MVYHHTDHLSGASVETDEAGYVVEVIDYNPFGSSRLDEKYTNTYENDKKFTGYELDGTGLHYANARYYNSDIGRFASLDPVHLVVGNSESLKEITGLDLYSYLQNPQTFNSYSYVANNPLVYVDPTGEFNKKQFMIGAFRTVSSIGGGIISLLAIKVAGASVIASGGITLPVALPLAASATLTVAESSVQAAYGINEMVYAVQDEDYNAGDGVLTTIINGLSDETTATSINQIRATDSIVNTLNNPTPFNLMNTGLDIYEMCKDNSNNNKSIEYDYEDKNEIIKPWKD